MAIYPSIPASRIPGTEEPGGLQSWGCEELDMTERRTPHGSFLAALHLAVYPPSLIPWPSEMFLEIISFNMHIVCIIVN